MNRSMNALAALLAFSMASAAPALAQDYPNRPISIVVPFAPGGPTDVSARLVANAMSAGNDFNVIVENVPGAGSVVGATKVSLAKADGYTLLWGSGSSLAMAPLLYANVKYDPVKSFAPIGLIASQPFVLVARPGLGVKTAAEFVALAKSKPGKLNYSSTGRGGSTHLVTELMQGSTGMTATHIPYNGGAPAMNALLAGDVDFLFETATITIPMVKSGRVVALAVTSEARWPALPETPTFRELGYKNLEATTWFGLLAPAGTPAPVVAVLSKRLATALASPPLISAMQQAGFIVDPLPPAEFAQKIADETVRWGGVIKAANVKLD